LETEVHLGLEAVVCDAEGCNAIEIEFNEDELLKFNWDRVEQAN
jgi:hypothetical protein